MTEDKTRDVARASDEGSLNHVAIAVPNLEEAASAWRHIPGARLSERAEQPAHGVSTIFVELPNMKIELLEPLGDDSPIRGFLDRHPHGGVHHICHRTSDVLASRDRLASAGIRALGDGEPKIGAHGKPVLFFRPKDLNGVLLELEEG